MKTFTKDDLRDGMVCTMRSERTYVYLRGSLLAVHDTMEDMLGYRDDLSFEAGDIGDIVKVTHGDNVVFEMVQYYEMSCKEVYDRLLDTGESLNAQVKATGCEWSSELYEITGVSPQLTDCFIRKDNANVEEIRVKK